MSKIVWNFEDEYAGNIKIKRGVQCMRKQADKPIPIRIVKHFKHIKITKKKNVKGPENIPINIKNANVDGDFHVKVNDSPIEYPYNFIPEDHNWEKIKIEISFQKKQTGNEGGVGDPDTTVTIGDAKPTNPPGEKKKKG